MGLLQTTWRVLNTPIKLPRRQPRTNPLQARVDALEEAVTFLLHYALECPMGKTRRMCRGLDLKPLPKKEAPDEA